MCVCVCVCVCVCAVCYVEESPDGGVFSELYDRVKSCCLRLINSSIFEHVSTTAHHC